MTIDLTTTPTIRYGRERTKKAVWTGDTGPDGKTLTFELAVTHDGDRKLFRAYATRSLASTDRGFAVNEYQPFRDIQRLTGMACPRYSAKGLEAAFEDALRELAYCADAPEITRLLDREPGE